MTNLQALKRGLVTSSGLITLLFTNMTIGLIALWGGTKYFILAFIVGNLIVLVTHIPSIIIREKKGHFKNTTYTETLERIEHKLDILIKEI